eukprot:6595564-Pyramimonas_sp.AAC.1
MGRGDWVPMQAFYMCWPSAFVSTCGCHREAIAALETSRPTGFSTGAMSRKLGDSRSPTCHQYA